MNIVNNDELIITFYFTVLLLNVFYCIDSPIDATGILQPNDTNN